jgi:hypothetical protein
MRPEGRAGIAAPQKLVGLKRRRRLKEISTTTRRDGKHKVLIKNDE